MKDLDIDIKEINKYIEALETEVDRHRARDPRLLSVATSSFRDSPSLNFRRDYWGEKNAFNA